ncbi:MAG: transcriptional regulator [Crocinitomicaceae bacterium]|nr:transcriptional regulator [Crocinitomicaceae bacterium]
MAQVHALLLTSKNALDTDQIMDELSISRGSANMNLRELMVWNLIYKVSKTGDRKEYFEAEKDMWEVMKRIAKERKRREIEPLKFHLSKLSNVEIKSEDSASFVNVLTDIERLVGRMDRVSDSLMRAEESAFFGSIIRLLK